MALTLPGSSTACVSLEEYVEHIERKVDIHNTESITASADMLRALANDRTLVVRKLNERIQSFLKDGSIPSAQSLLLARSERFYVRANIWPAISDMSNGRAYQNQFAYNIAHDHNFTFMTVGYLGPGYETEIYEYDYSSVRGCVGETVDLRFLEKVTFSSGMVMLYRASRDIHVQFAPSELTITLNLVIPLSDTRIREQYYFDLTKRQLSAYADQFQTTSRASLVNLAGHVGNGNTLSLLDDLARKHPCRRTRLTAYAALCRQQPQLEAEFWRKAMDDPAPLVVSEAKRRLGALEKA